MYMSKACKIILTMLLLLNLIVLSTLVGVSNRETVVTYTVENREVDSQRLLGANVSIYNSTIRSSGSGTHIKIDGKSYILSCAHLIMELEDTLWMEIGDRIQTPLTLVKQDVYNDLSLFEFDPEIEFPYVEISKIYPEPADEVLVIGNPEGEIDIITNGIISKKDKNYYIITNKIFFGNSGGAVLYNGKLVGVVSRLNVLYSYDRISIQVVYGIAINLESIKSFLEDDDYEMQNYYEPIKFEM